MCDISGCVTFGKHAIWIFDRRIKFCTRHLKRWKKGNIIMTLKSGVECCNTITSKQEEGDKK